MVGHKRWSYAQSDSSIAEIIDFWEMVHTRYHKYQIAHRHRDNNNQTDLSEIIVSENLGGHHSISRGGGGGGRSFFLYK